MTTDPFTDPEQAFLSRWAEQTPGKPAVVMADSGETLTYRQLDQRSNQFAHAVRDAGVGRGGHVAYLLENSLRCFEVIWGAHRSGCYYTPVNTRFNADEVAYVLRDSGARVLVASARFAHVAAEAARIADVEVRLADGGTIDGFTEYDDVVGGVPTDPIGDQSTGSRMLYSSGTTGRPKGVKRPLPAAPLDATDPWLTTQTRLYQWSADTRYLCPAPLYHGAGLWWTTAMHRIGATTIVMPRFDAEAFLATVQNYRVTCTQLVPTMFVRLLRLPPDVRAAYDVSSLTAAIHAAAPCPDPVKEAMLEWWGPIVYEYYAASEGIGSTWISPAEWREHPGSVGRAVVGKAHVVDEAGTEVPTGTVGTIYFESPAGDTFEYHNDPVKTAESRLVNGWVMTGDMGYIDDEGYIYLTDRRSHMIISGGVNIYPQEVENLLASHEYVDDVAVIGVPNAEFGEEVKAVVKLVPGVTGGAELEQDLITFCRDHLAHFKCPKSVDFVADLPRGDNGKLYKLQLRQRYGPDGASLISTQPG